MNAEAKSLPLKPATKTKRVHLSTESGGRSRCRYTSRPSTRAKFVPLADFVAVPVEMQCVECAKLAAASSRSNHQGWISRSGQKDQACALKSTVGTK